MTACDHNSCPQACCLTCAALSTSRRPSVSVHAVQGETPLMAASKRGNLKIVTELLQAGANPEAIGAKVSAAHIYTH